MSDLVYYEFMTLCLPDRFVCGNIIVKLDVDAVSSIIMIIYNIIYVFLSIASI